MRGKNPGSEEPLGGGKGTHICCSSFGFGHFCLTQQKALLSSTGLRAKVIL